MLSGICGLRAIDCAIVCMNSCRVADALLSVVLDKDRTTCEGHRAQSPSRGLVKLRGAVVIFVHWWCGVAAAHPPTVDGS